jgi:hypothetical protein
MQPTSTHVREYEALRTLILLINKYTKTFRNESLDHWAGGQTRIIQTMRLQGLGKAICRSN